MNQAIYERLKEVARAKEVINYSEIMPNRRVIGRILEEICRYEVQRGHPMLAAVVVRKDTRMPGKAFFDLAHRLDTYTGNDDRTFWKSELSRVHNYWQSH